MSSYNATTKQLDELLRTSSEQLSKMSPETAAKYLNERRTQIIKEMEKLSNEKAQIEKQLSQMATNDLIQKATQRARREQEEAIRTTEVDRKFNGRIFAKLKQVEEQEDKNRSNLEFEAGGEFAIIARKKDNEFLLKWPSYYEALSLSKRFS